MATAELKQPFEHPDARHQRHNSGTAAQHKSLVGLRLAEPVRDRSKAPTITICPISTPTLNPMSADASVPWASPKSINALAKPNP